MSDAAIISPPGSSRRSKRLSTGDKENDDEENVPAPPVAKKAKKAKAGEKNVEEAPVEEQPIDEKVRLFAPQSQNQRPPKVGDAVGKTFKGFGYWEGTVSAILEGGKRCVVTWRKPDEDETTEIMTTLKLVDVSDLIASFLLNGSNPHPITPTDR